MTEAEPPRNEFDIEGGLLGLGEDLLIELIHEMRSVRDVQNFLGLNKATKNLMKHARFSIACETAAADRTGTKALVLLRLPHVHYLTDPEPKQEDLEAVGKCVFDVTKNPEITTAAAQRINSMTVQYKNLRIDSNSSFFAHAIIYIDGVGRLRKSLCTFDDLSETAEKKPTAEKWVESIKLPPETETFVKVRSSGNFTMALSTKGELWTRGWTNDGLWTESEEFSVLPRFKTDDGLYQTSLGKSRVKDFSFDASHVIIVFENGAVWAFGSIQEFAGYHSSISSDGFVELTDSSKLKTRYFDCTCGDLPKEEGQYGIFGKYKPVKYFRHMYAFLSEDGVPIIRVIHEIDHKNTYWYTPVDIKKYFGGKKIVNMNRHLDDLYIAEDGECFSYWPDRYTNEVAEALGNRKANRYIPFDMQRLKATLLCRHEYVTLFRDDGKLLCLNLEKGKETEEPKDVSANVVAETKDEKNPNGMVIKWYAQANLSCYFLCE